MKPLYHRVGISTLASIVVLAWAAASHADLSGDLHITMQKPGQEAIEQEGRIYLKGDSMDPEAMRMEFTPEGQDMGMTFITSTRDEVAYIVMDEMEMYMTMDISDAADQQPDHPAEQYDPDAELEDLGQETVEGVRTNVKGSTVKDEHGQTVGEMKVYLAPAFGDYPIKSEFVMEDGTQTTSIIRNPSDETLADSLFEPPADYAETQLPDVGQFFEELGEGIQEDLEQSLQEGVEGGIEEGIQDRTKDLEEGIKDALPF